jgi:hypothetical protein
MRRQACACCPAANCRLAHHMTDLAYFLRGGLRNCENLKQTTVSLLPRSFCLRWRRFTLDTANRPPVNRLQPFPPPHFDGISDFK